MHWLACHFPFISSQSGSKQLAFLLRDSPTGTATNVCIYIWDLLRCVHSTTPDLLNYPPLEGDEVVWLIPTIANSVMVFMDMYFKAGHAKVGAKWGQYGAPGCRERRRHAVSGSVLAKLSFSKSGSRQPSDYWYYYYLLLLLLIIIINTTYKLYDDYLVLLLLLRFYLS